jgi:hypothetical protein
MDGFNVYFDREVWECMVDAIQTRFLHTEFEEGEFKVLVNEKMGSITVVRGRRAWTLLDITGSHLTGGGSEGEPICVHLPATQQQT